MTTVDSPKKTRWSSVFKKKDRSDSVLPTVPQSDQRLSEAEDQRYSSSHTNPVMQNSQQYDSAYASSEPPSLRSENNNNSNIVPVENNGRFENVSADRNLAVNQANGDVLDKDTGEVVSTVTTTTTTTTTTTMRKGKNGETIVEVQTQPAGQPQGAGQTLAVPQKQPENTPATAPSSVPAGIVEAPDNSIESIHSRHDSTQQPPIPEPSPEQRRSPVIPARSPHRQSRELDSIQRELSSQPNAPAHHNFSTPSRANLRQSGEYTQPTPEHKPVAQTYAPTGAPMAPSTSRSPFDSLRSLAKEQTSSETYANLKAAAKGLHGVGETLRGALNNELDTRFSGDSEAAAAANAKNQQTLERGRAEMQTGRKFDDRETWNNAGGPAMVPGYGTQVSPVEPQGTQWQQQTTAAPARSESQLKGFRKLIKKRGV